jgi:outer membrane protein assembly factor BamB
MRARKAFIFTADAIIAFYLITIMLSILLLINYTPRTYVQQFQTVAKDTLTVLSDLKLKDVGGDPLYPYSTYLVYVKNNSVTLWPMFRRTLEHNASIVSVYPNSSSIWWVWKLGPSGVDTPVYSSPTLYNGKLIAASRNGTYAFDENSGTQLWYYPIPADSSPAISNGKIFIGSTNFDFYSIDEEGNVVWNVTLGGKILSSPMIHNGKVFVGSMDGSLYAFDESSGKLIWVFTASGCQPLCNISSSPAVYDGKVFVLTDDSHLYAVDEESGRSIWTYIGAGGAFFSPLAPSPAVAKGIVYSSNQTALYALNATNGSFLWVVTTCLPLSSPVIDEGWLYVGCREGLLKVNATAGAPSTLYLVPSAIYSSPVISNDTIITATEGGDVIVWYKANMSQLWQYNIGKPIYSSPAVVNGRIYIGANDGNLYSFGNCSISNPNLSVLETIASFWLIEKKVCAEALAKEFLAPAIPQNYGFELVVKSAGMRGYDCNNRPANWDSIYTNDCNQSRYQRVLIQDSRYISGILQSGSTIYYAKNPIQIELRIWN